MINKTYNGIYKATCLKCGYKTEDISALVILNDLDNDCWNCQEKFTKWETDNGTFITCELKDYKGNTHYFREEIK